MTIIKNARIFAAQLPAIAALAECLAALQFVPVLPTMRRSVGFISDPVTGEVVTPIAGGYSFVVRHDEKVLPVGPVKEKLAAALKAKEDELERELDSDEQDRVMQETETLLLANALVKTSSIRAFYFAADELLIVAVSSNPPAQVLLKALCRAMGSIKTCTIHIDSIRQGLSTRLGNHLDMESVGDAFSGFTLGSYCRLSEKGDSAVFDMGDLINAGKGMKEALGAGMTVDRIGMTHEQVSFRLTKDFALVKIEYPELSEEQLDEFDKSCGESGGADAAFYWRHEAGVELIQLAALVRSLCVLFDYARPMELPVMEAPVVEAVEVDDHANDQCEADPLYEDAVKFVRESQRPSVSAVQRHLKIGYNRACHMFEQMESDGIVSEMQPDGSRFIL
jgi:recombination associated protein RdgC